VTYSPRRFLFLITVAGVFSAACAADKPLVTSVPPPQDILFVGNSFTFYNNGLHNHLRSMMQAADREIGSLRAMTISGARLAEHAPALPSILESSEWDIVILQGHSMEAIDDGLVEGFHQAVRGLVPQIRGSGANPVLFMTWSRTHIPGQIVPLNERYTLAGNNAGALVVPVGLAFDRLVRQENGISLRMEDQRHPTLAGAYLATCTFYAAFFGESPVGIPYTAGLDADVARTLQIVAAETVSEYYGVELDEAA
jgi:hypothetical protein